MSEQEEQIIQELSAKIEHEPNAENYINRANFYWTMPMTEYEKAIADYTSALSFENCPDSVYYNRGGVYFQNGDYDNALQDLNIAVKLLPTPKTYHGRGDTYRILKQYKQAIKDYSKAIELNKDFPSAYKFRAECYYELGNFSQAINDYNKAIETYTEDEDLYNSRAFSYWQFKDKLQNVILDFTKIIELNPKNLKAYTDRGYAYYQNKEYEKSISDFQKFIELEETNTGDNNHTSYLDVDFAYGRIGVNQMKLKNYDEAITNLEKCVYSNNKCASHYDLFLKSLAYCYIFKKRNYIKTLHLLIKAIHYKTLDIISVYMFNFIYKIQNVLHLSLIRK